MKKVLVAVAVLVLLVGFLIVTRDTKKDVSLVGSSLGVTTPSIVPSISVTPTPKTFKFDSQTNLKKELEEIDPRVLDSDFQ